MNAQTDIRHFICRAVIETANNARLLGIVLLVVSQMVGATCWGQNGQLSREVEELVMRGDYQSTEFIALLREKGVTEPSHLEPYLENAKSGKETLNALAAMCVMVRHAKPEERHRALKYFSGFVTKQQVHGGVSSLTRTILQNTDYPFALEYFNLRIEKADAWELGTFFQVAVRQYDDWIKSSDQAGAVVRRAVGQLPEALRKTPTGNAPVWFLLSLSLNKAPFTNEEFALLIIDVSSKALEKPGTLTDADVHGASDILMNRYRQSPNEVQRRMIDLVCGGSSNRAKIIWWHVIRVGYGDEKSRSELKDCLLERWPALREFVDQVGKEGFKTDSSDALELRMQVGKAHAEERSEVLKKLQEGSEPGRQGDQLRSQ